MSEHHDKIAAARERGDVAELLRMTVASLGATEAGEYCECDTPTGEALACGHCLRRSKSAELIAVHRIVDAHEFVAGKLRGLMCAVCTQVETDPRHHGTPAVGRTSWGESVQGVVAG